MQMDDEDRAGVPGALAVGPLEGAQEAAAALIVRHTSASWCRVTLDMSPHDRHLVAEQGEAPEPGPRQRLPLEWFGVPIGHVEIVPPLRDPARVGRLLEMMKPILAARRALERSRRAEGRERDFLLGVLNSLAQPVFVKSEEARRYVTVNDAFCQLVGRDRLEIHGRTDAELVDGATAQAWRRADDDAIHTGGSDVEEHVPGLDGRERAFLTSRRMVTLGHERYLVGVRTELTQRKAAEQARVAAERESQLKSLFLEMIGHETRTPLNAILGLGELLQGTRLDESQRKLVETLHSSGRSLLELIDDILDFVALQGGQVAIAREPTDLVAVVERVVQEIQPHATARGLLLWCTAQADVPRRVRTDPARLTQILQNLVRNAVRFTDEGHVHLDVRRTWDRDGETGVSLSVRDTGIGLDATERDTLFEPFSQVDVSSRRRRGGAGLGLAISKKLCEALGGDLTVDSAPGLGSVFRVALPCGEEDELRPPAPLRGRVALVHPAAPWRYAVARMLRGWGLEVTATPDLRRLDRADAVLAALPDALTVARRGLGGPAAIVAIVEPDQAADALDVDAVLPWPAPPSALREVLESMLGQPTPSRAAEATPAGRLGGMQLLLVEDNAVNRLVAERMLRSLGCVVTTVAGGREALDSLARQLPDLVLMDLHMPDMDGWETTQAIRGLPGPAGEVPIIAVTASATAAARRRCRDVGMNGFLPKPISVQRLEATLLEVLAR